MDNINTEILEAFYNEMMNTLKSDSKSNPKILNKPKLLVERMV